MRPPFLDQHQPNTMECRIQAEKPPILDLINFASALWQATLRIWPSPCLSLDTTELLSGSISDCSTDRRSVRYQTLM